MKVSEILQRFELELGFVERWIRERPVGMMEYLLGKKSTLKEVIQQLKEYEEG